MRCNNVTALLIVRAGNCSQSVRTTVHACTTFGLTSLKISDHFELERKKEEKKNMKNTTERNKHEQKWKCKKSSHDKCAMVPINTFHSYEKSYLFKKSSKRNSTSALRESEEKDKKQTIFHYNIEILNSIN